MIKELNYLFAVGRPPMDIKPLMDKLNNLFDGYITLNGQYCYDANNKIIHEQALDKDDLIKLTDYLKDKDYCLWFY